MQDTKIRKVIGKVGDVLDVLAGDEPRAVTKPEPEPEPEPEPTLAEAIAENKGAVAVGVGAAIALGLLLTGGKRRR